AIRAADTMSKDARAFRVTSELATTPAYGISQAWADVFDASGFGGVVCRLRFSPDETVGLALFGAAGRPEPGLPSDRRPPSLLECAREMGIVGAPTLAAVQVVQP
ncbi:MAG: hypothetical protein QM655_11380, partial [Nocardioidaceae bacterium]